MITRYFYMVMFALVLSLPHARAECSYCAGGSGSERSSSSNPSVAAPSKERRTTVYSSPRANSKSSRSTVRYSGRQIDISPEAKAARRVLGGKSYISSRGNQTPTQEQLRAASIADQAVTRKIIELYNLRAQKNLRAAIERRKMKIRAAEIAMQKALQKKYDQMEGFDAREKIPEVAELVEINRSNGAERRKEEAAQAAARAEEEKNRKPQIYVRQGNQPAAPKKVFSNY